MFPVFPATFYRHSESKIMNTMQAQAHKVQKHKHTQGTKQSQKAKYGWEEGTSKNKPATSGRFLFNSWLMQSCEMGRTFCVVFAIYYYFWTMPKQAQKK